MSDGNRSTGSESGESSQLNSSLGRVLDADTVEGRSGTLPSAVANGELVHRPLGDEGAGVVDDLDSLRASVGNRRDYFEVLDAMDCGGSCRIRCLFCQMLIY